MAKAGSLLWPRKSTGRGTETKGHSALLQGSQAAEQPIEMVSQDRAGESGVHQRRAFFEAMIRSNSDTFVSCSSPRSPQSKVTVSRVQPASKPSWGQAHNTDKDASEQDYNEVQLTFRMPKHDRLAAPEAAAASLQVSLPAETAGAPEIRPAFTSATDPLSPRQVNHAQTETIAALQLELERKECQCQADAARLKRKSKECDNLTRVVRELAQGRAKLVAGRAAQAERLAELQHQYERVLKISDLSRSLSKENMAKAAQAQRQLKSVEEEVGQQQRLVAYLKDRNGRLALEHLEAQERIKLLERLPLFQCNYSRESACMLEFTAFKLRETY